GTGVVRVGRLRGGRPGGVQLRLRGRAAHRGAPGAVSAAQGGGLGGGADHGGPDMSDATRRPQDPLDAIAELYRRVRDLEMQRLRGGGALAVWETYTPTLTNLNVGSTGTVEGHYAQVVDVVIFRIIAQLGGTGLSVGDARFSLPVLALSGTGYPMAGQVYL